MSSGKYLFKIHADTCDVYLHSLTLEYRYVCVWKKGYQDTDTILSSVTTKVKGIAFTNTTELGERIWDVADYIIPPQVVRRYDTEVDKPKPNHLGGATHGLMFGEVTG